MNGPEDPAFPRRAGTGDEPGVAAELGPSLDEISAESDNTIELPLVLPVGLVGGQPLLAPGANGLGVRHGGSGDFGDLQDSPSEMLGETPTAPLPVDIDVDGFDAAPVGDPGTDAPTDWQGELDALDAELREDAREVDDEELEILEASVAAAVPLAPPASAAPAPVTPASVVAPAAPRRAPAVVLVPPPIPVAAPVARTSAAVTAAPVRVGVPVDPAELLQPTEAWAEPLAQRPRRKRLKPWFEEVFDEDYLRTLPFMTAEQTLREVNFIKDGLGAPPEGELLDVACGYGRHAIELAQRGLRVTGIDLSLPLLIRAADESQRRSLSVNFVHADMRELSFENQFDGAYSMLTSFGYFDEETNLKVATGVCRALKPGGRFLVDTVNRDYIVGQLPTRVWWEGDGCLVLEEVDFNYHTSRLAVRRSVVFQDGRQLEHDISIRAYSLHELGKLMRQAGFRVVDVAGSIATRGHFFGATSRNLIMLCEKSP